MTRVDSTPYDLHKRRELEVVFKQDADDEKTDFQNKAPVAKQVYIKPSDIDQSGMTGGRPRCDHRMAYGPWRTSKPHFKRRSDRIMGELSKTLAGGARRAAPSDLRTNRE